MVCHSTYGSNMFQPLLGQAAVSKFLDCVGVNVVFTKTNSQGFLGMLVMDSLSSVASNKNCGLKNMKK